MFKEVILETKEISYRARMSIKAQMDFQKITGRSVQSCIGAEYGTVEIVGMIHVSITEPIKEAQAIKFVDDYVNENGYAALIAKINEMLDDAFQLTKLAEMAEVQEEPTKATKKSQSKNS